MHKPVLLKEVIEYLNPKTGDVVFDGTVGNGGHARFMCERIGREGTFIGVDEDVEALAKARENLKEFSCTKYLEKENFTHLDIVLEKHGIGGVDAFLFDLGIRSEQLEASGMGFSFKRDEPLLMTFDRDPQGDALTAFRILNTWNEEDLRRILFEYGEERYGRRIARAIVEARKIKPVGKTFELVSLIEKSIPARMRHGRLHFATKTFQALRIAVNNELENLAMGLQKAFRYLAPGGRIAVISFHSLEDRIVKNIFREKSKEGGFTLCTKKPIMPDVQEQKENSRSRSSKLRVIVKR